MEKKSKRIKKVKKTWLYFFSKRTLLYPRRFGRLHNSLPRRTGFFPERFFDRRARPFFESPGDQIGPCFFQTDPPPELRNRPWADRKKSLWDCPGGTDGR